MLKKIPFEICYEPSEGENENVRSNKEKKFFSCKFI